MQARTVSLYAFRFLYIYIDFHTHHCCYMKWLPDVDIRVHSSILFHRGKISHSRFPDPATSLHLVLGTLPES